MEKKFKNLGNKAERLLKRFMLSLLNKMTAKHSRQIWLNLVNGLKSEYFTQEQLASQKDKLRRLKFCRYGEIVNDKWFKWVSYHYPALLVEFDKLRNMEEDETEEEVLPLFDKKDQLNLF